jgi:hypothetical protein
MRRLQSRLFAIVVAILMLGGYAHQALGFCAFSPAKEHSHAASENSMTGETEQLDHCCSLSPSSPSSDHFPFIFPLSHSGFSAPAPASEYPEGERPRIERPPQAR